jgi:hypothetical protein
VARIRKSTPSSIVTSWISGSVTRYCSNYWTPHSRDTPKPPLIIQWLYLTTPPGFPICAWYGVWLVDRAIASHVR